MWVFPEYLSYLILCFALIRAVSGKVVGISSGKVSVEFAAEVGVLVLKVDVQDFVTGSRCVASHYTHKSGLSNARTGYKQTSCSSGKSSVHLYIQFIYTGSYTLFLALGHNIVKQRTGGIVFHSHLSADTLETINYPVQSLLCEAAVLYALLGIFQLAKCFLSLNVVGTDFSGGSHTFK